MIDRREFLARCSAAGLAQTLLPGALLVLASQAHAVAEPMPSVADLPPLTPEMLEAAANVAGLTLTPEQRAMMLDGVRSNRDGLPAVRAMKLPNAVAPATVFDPRPAGFRLPPPTGIGIVRGLDLPEVDASEQDKVAFATVGQLCHLLALRKMSSVDLTKLYLARLRRFDPQLHCVITYLDDRALAQAAQADREIAAGKMRGPLHGMPLGREGFAGG